MANRKILWYKTAQKQLAAAINYIVENSLQNAKKVEQEIFEKIECLISYPEIHSADKYKIDNDGSYRAFELHHYRIAYRVIKNEIRILRIMHRSREPKSY